MDEPPDIQAFPAQRLGAFLRAMADPEGSGHLDASEEQAIARLEEAIAQAHLDMGDAD